MLENIIMTVFILLLYHYSIHNEMV